MDSGTDTAGMLRPKKQPASSSGGDIVTSFNQPVDGLQKSLAGLGGILYWNRLCVFPMDPCVSYLAIVYISYNEKLTMRNTSPHAAVDMPILRVTHSSTRATRLSRRPDMLRSGGIGNDGSGI